MMQEAERIALYQAASVAISTLDPIPQVQWDNRDLVDMGKQVDPFLCIDFVVASGVQKSLGNVKVVRYTGMLAMLALIKQGQGISAAVKMIDSLAHALQMKNIDGVVTEAAMPQAPKDINGWHHRPLVVPFWFDDIVVS
jgi:hypothetical protein